MPAKVRLTGSARLRENSRFLAPPSRPRSWWSLRSIRRARSTATRSARSTICCSPPDRIGRTTAVFASRSDSPMITAKSAPLLSAAFICDFMLRLSKARSAVRPTPRSSSVTASASAPPVTSTTNTSRAGAGAPNTPSSSQASSVRSMPMANPIAGVGGPPSASIKPVVATAAAERVLGAVERAAGELEGRPDVVVEPAYEARRDLVRDAERIEATHARFRNARRSRRRRTRRSSARRR